MAAPRWAPPPALEGQELFQLLEAVMDLPRWLGAPGRDDAVAALASLAEARGATVVQQRFEGRDPKTGERYALTNLYASVRPDAPSQFVLATHFDVRPWAEEDPDAERRDSPIRGANDGSSGVAVALGLLEALARDLPADVGFSVILFDGEELGRPGHGGYCAGSRFFAAHPEDAPSQVQRARFGIVLDMVGDADLNIEIEPRSQRYNPGLVEALWTVAERLDARAFKPRLGATGIIDDHVGLTETGIPSVLLIDYDYPAWHTHADTIDRVSPRSLETVALVVYETVLEQTAGPGPT